MMQLAEAIEAWVKAEGNCDGSTARCFEQAAESRERARTAVEGREREQRGAENRRQAVLLGEEGYKNAEGQNIWPDKKYAQEMVQLSEWVASWGQKCGSRHPGQTWQRPGMRQNISESLLCKIPRMHCGSCRQRKRGMRWRRPGMRQRRPGMQRHRHMMQLCKHGNGLRRKRWNRLRTHKEILSVVNCLETLRLAV